MNLLPIRIALPARVIAGFYLMAAFWPHRIEKGGKRGQNPANELFVKFPELLQSTLFRRVI
jgi:hypothetical protein